MIECEAFTPPRVSHLTFARETHTCARDRDDRQQRRADRGAGGANSSLQADAVLVRGPVVQMQQSKMGTFTRLEVQHDGRRRPLWVYQNAETSIPVLLDLGFLACER